MNHHQSHYIKNLLLPCLAFSIFTGVFSSVFITLFKIAVSFIVGISERFYATARANPVWLPILIGGAALLGLASALVLSFSPDCRGGAEKKGRCNQRGMVDPRKCKSP